MLSPREQEIVQLVLKGFSGPQIAAALYISTHTEKSYRKEIYQKLNIHSKRELFDLANNAAVKTESKLDVYKRQVYNTRGFVVDQAVFTFSGNSWGIPANAVDIALLAGTTTTGPYDPTTELAQNNSSANISDQR